MKKIILFISFIAFSFWGNAQETTINWMSIEEAVAAQAKEPRKIMMDMYTTWCGPCKLLDKNTFQNKDVAEYVNENYYAVKFNAEGDEEVTFKEILYTNPNFDASRRGRNSQHQLAAAFGVSAYPTIVFLDENSDLLTPLKGYHTPNQLEIFLKVFATDAYKEITSKEDFIAYQKNFNSEFGRKKSTSPTIAKVEAKTPKPIVKQQSTPIKKSPTVVASAKVVQKPVIQTTTTKVTVHTVVEGETLGKIAKKYYKNAGLYPKIYEANTTILKNPNNIYLGQVLTIPSL